MSLREKNQIEYIKQIKKKYGDRILIPAHHYIDKDLVEIADIVGDSYKLAVDVAKSDAEFIIFCGVKFMAEGAAILAKNEQKIFHPVDRAGCPMADMITSDKAEQIFEIIKQKTGIEPAPVVYMNSYGDSKAFTGRKGGSVCTSSNAYKIIQYYFDQNKPVFFFPDYHLGRNIADDMGISEQQIVRVRQDLTFEREPDKDTKIYLWDGFCHVHQKFYVSDVEEVRNRFPGIWVIVHPEADRSVVQASNQFGSTQQIYNLVKESPEGSKWAIGTEINFVERVAAENPDKIIVPLKMSPCFNMGRITPASVASVLESIDKSLEKGTAMPRTVKVDQTLSKDASIALNQMISIVEQK
jgi:quinolinate synthase